MGNAATAAGFNDSTLNKPRCAPQPSHLIMQAQPAAAGADAEDDSAASSSGEEGDEYGFEIPVMSAQVRMSIATCEFHLVHCLTVRQSVERATFARLAIESHYELLLKGAQATPPPQYKIMNRD